MNRNILQIVIVSIFISLAWSQQSWAVNCSSADIVLTSQEAVNNFQADYGNGGVCDTVTGSLTVKGPDNLNPVGDIINLDGLLEVTNIGGDLDIRLNKDLTNIDGLANLTNVAGSLGFSRNPSLVNIDGLNNLSGAVNGLSFWQNGSLVNINALINLTEASAITIYDNGSLESVAGLANLRGVLGFSSIERNSNLTNIDGLEGLTGMSSQLRIVDNPSLANIDGLIGLINVDSLTLWNNNSLTNIDGLENLTSARSLTLEGNNLLASVAGLKNLADLAILRILYAQSLTNLDGLENLTTLSVLDIQDNPLMSNIDGLKNLVEMEGNLSLSDNDALVDVGGLAKLTYVDGVLYITGNTSLIDVHGLSSLTKIGKWATIERNKSLTSLDGLSSLVYVGDHIAVAEHESLAQCQGLVRLLDQWDDAEPGPGPGTGPVGTDGIPDVGSTTILRDNLAGCNSIEEIFADTDTSRINAGLNDAWYNPETDGQGFFISVFPDLASASLAWFTYDTELPPDDAQANLGDPGHRWLTAIGPIEGNEVWMDIEMTSGGLFDTPTDIQRTDPPGSDGTIILTFTSCNSGTVEYDIPSINQQGIVPIQRVADDNIELCELLSNN